MKGTRHSLRGADGVPIGLLTAGSGPALLLVHGGMGCIERWAPLWDALADRWRVTAMDRRGRGSSGDGASYTPRKEYEDIAAVAASLAEAHGPIDVFGHSIGATFTLGAAALGAPFRRVALYEPPGPQTVSSGWIDRVTNFVAEGNPGRAMYSFLTEIIGMTPARFEELRAAPKAYDVLSIVSATMPREARALTEVDLLAQAAHVAAPVLLLLGADSPPWAGEITRSLAGVLPASRLVTLPGQGHEAINAAPDLVLDQLRAFF